MNWRAPSVMTTWTSAPAWTRKLVRSAALYAAMPPDTPRTIVAPARPNRDSGMDRLSLEHPLDHAGEHLQCPLDPLVRNLVVRHQPNSAPSEVIREDARLPEGSHDPELVEGSFRLEDDDVALHRRRVDRQGRDRRDALRE